MSKNIKKTVKKSREYATIMGIKVLSTSNAKVLTRVSDFISHNRSNNKNKAKIYIVTPNPEIVLMSQKNPRLKSAINNADISIPDGVGLSQADSFLRKDLGNSFLERFIRGLFYGLKLGYQTIVRKPIAGDGLNIIKGRVLFSELISLASQKGWKVFLLGGLSGEAQECQETLVKIYPKLKVQSFQGPYLDKNAKPVTDFDIKLHYDAVKLINNYKPELLFVAFENPKQEIWISENLSKLNTKVAMAVGGTFRYVAGHRRLPSEGFENSGLEWLWRLATEPKRFKRVWNAFPVFPLKIFLMKISNKT